ncbi:acyl-CoA N-acyltransferase [Mycena filopes]|nr:acyl-CoA N-acyltransferase [Mycena filopes]
MIPEASLPSKSGRIILVPWAERDDEAFAAMRSHPETRRHLKFFPVQFSVADARVMRLQRDADPTMIPYNIHILGDHPDYPEGTFVGATALTHIDTDYGRSCETGILVSPAFFRTGMATEALHTLIAHAFEERKFHRVEFFTVVGNAPMRAWLDKVGVTFEGTRRGYWGTEADGYDDVCMYGILKEEWSTVKGKIEAQMNRPSV